MIKLQIDGQLITHNLQFGINPVIAKQAETTHAPCVWLILHSVIIDCLAFRLKLGNDPVSWRSRIVSPNLVNLMATLDSVFNGYSSHALKRICNNYDPISQLLGV